MGAAMSDSASKSLEQGQVQGLGDMPESCLASVLLYLDPPEICRFASVNRAFYRASCSDFVWEPNLPSNYRYLMKKLYGDVEENLSKKEIYARLHGPNSFDSGTKEVWLDRTGGGICISVSSKALKITGIDDRRYWTQIPTEESRFGTVAYLQQMWWLEAEGELEFKFPPGTYSLFFRLHLGKAWKNLGRRVCKLDQVHGWNIKPVRFQLSTSDGQHSLSQCYLHHPGQWVHYHVGDFVVGNSKTLLKIKFSVTQIDCTHTKGGLCVDSVLICPSQSKEMLKGF